MANLKLSKLGSLLGSIVAIKGTTLADRSLMVQNLCTHLHTQSLLANQSQFDIVLHVKHIRSTKPSSTSPVPTSCHALNCMSSLLAATKLLCTTISREIWQSVTCSYSIVEPLSKQVFSCLDDAAVEALEQLVELQQGLLQVAECNTCPINPSQPKYAKPEPRPVLVVLDLMCLDELTIGQPGMLCFSRKGKALQSLFTNSKRLNITVVVSTPNDVNVSLLFGFDFGFVFEVWQSYNLMVSCAVTYTKSNKPVTSKPFALSTNTNFKFGASETWMFRNTIFASLKSQVEEQLRIEQTIKHQINLQKNTPCLKQPESTSGQAQDHLDQPQETPELAAYDLYDASCLKQGGVLVAHGQSRQECSKLLRDVCFKLKSCIDLAVVFSLSTETYDFVPSQMHHNTLDEQKLTCLMTMQKQLLAKHKHFLVAVVLDFANLDVDMRCVLSSLRLACLVSTARHLNILVLATQPATDTVNSAENNIWGPFADVVCVKAPTSGATSGLVTTPNATLFSYKGDLCSQHAFQLDKLPIESVLCVDSSQNP